MIITKKFCRIENNRSYETFLLFKLKNFILRRKILEETTHQPPMIQNVLKFFKFPLLLQLFVILIFADDCRSTAVIVHGTIIAR